MSADILKHFKDAPVKPKKKLVRNSQKSNVWMNLRSVSLVHCPMHNIHSNALRKLRVQWQLMTLRCLLFQTFFTHRLKSKLYSKKKNKIKNLYSERSNFIFIANPKCWEGWTNKKGLLWSHVTISIKADGRLRKQIVWKGWRKRSFVTFNGFERTKKQKTCKWIGFVRFVNI